MEAEPLERAVLLVCGGLVLIAAVVSAVGVSPAEVPPAEDYPVELPEHRAPTPTPVRAAPALPRTPPDGALTTRESGLAVWDIEAGSGASPVDGQVVQVDYVAWLENGTAIESTATRLDPMRFVMGAGLVPAGLGEGVRGMQLGGTRQLIVPPELAYGEEGVLNRVPANATLTYEVELTGLWNLPETPPTAEAWTALPDGVRIADVVMGTGRALGPRNAARFDYAMWANGALVASSYAGPRPMRARLGMDQLFAGWESGMVGMHVGGRRLIEVPAELGYGAEGQGEIPPNTPLVLEVVLHRVM